MKQLFNRKHLLFIFICVHALCVNAQQKLHLNFLNVVGDSAMQLGNTYSNAFNESFTIRNFKYYISNIQLKDANGKMHAVSKEYFLVNEADTASKTISLNHTVANAVSIRFLLGVDSIRNVSGVQTGALDPSKGMFWTWNSGYVMAKLEGKSAASKSLGNYFTYHIGGFKRNEKAARWIELPLSIGANQTIYIKADAGKWFNGLHEIKIAEKPVCHEPGELAMLIADNYATMFSIVEEKK